MLKSKISREEVQTRRQDINLILLDRRSAVGVSKCHETDGQLSDQSSMFSP